MCICEGAGASNCMYRKAWRFFEQKRILEGKPKSAKRVEQEQRWGPEGFPLQHDSGVRYVHKDTPPEVAAKFFDIEVARPLYVLYVCMCILHLFVMVPMYHQYCQDLRQAREVV